MIRTRANWLKESCPGGESQLKSRQMRGAQGRQSVRISKELFGGPINRLAGLIMRLSP